eukprot:CAMPEP_0172414624 /NCGR_PEP_ID=MMETSP1064-20121228/1267_1 /TAXON_ID=202472 /ORGANISM="Aulacoseira subarctica , Strain CCAP 1002/5" /LENGTH=805 /DNA_ID=CAMNT_0013151379 /DNA_START=42 /DNA_END=2459 /DNA_ORIENTATION=-
MSSSLGAASSSNAAAAKKKFVIKPFRSHTPMDESHARSIFAQLSLAMEEIHNRNASQLSFEELYRNAYNLVLHKHGTLLYEGIAFQLSSHLEKVASAVSEVPDALLLECIASAWEDQSVTMVMIRDIFMYMDRTYVPQQKKRPVYELGLMLFQQVVWEHPLIQPRVTLLMLEAIQQERGGQIAPSFLLKSIVSMMLELGGSASSDNSKADNRHLARQRYTDTSNNPNNRNIYERDFERLFLDTSQEFYHLESSSILSQSTASEFVRKATSRLSEELSRSQRYLAPTTEATLINICEMEWIQTHAKSLVEMEATGFIALLQDSTHKKEELRQMYDLFSRVPATVDLLRDALGNAVKTEGRALLQDQERGVSDSTTFIKGILNTRERFSEVVSYAFRGEKKTSKRLKESLEDVLNRDNRAANCLAIYADELLKNGLKGITSNAAGEFFSQAVDAELQTVVTVFRYLQDKDVFENYYKQHLAKRLLTGKSASEEAEKVMVSLLKAECGYQFTSKLEGMFNDMRISRDTRDAYKRHIKGIPLAEGEGKGLDLEVDVLTTGYWPSQSVPPCILPAQVNEATRKFSAYYLQKHTGRKLSWQTSTGSAEVRATFGDVGKYRRHDLLVTTYQMCILELFNSSENDTLTLAEIKSKTNIPDAELRRHLISLCTPKHRIIKKASRGKAIADDDSFTFNKDFTSKLKRVKIPLVSMKETLTEDGKCVGGMEDGGVAAELPKEVEEDRRHLVEAVIMRVMKARKTLHHNDLIAEVTRQLQVRFLARPQFIKKRVESLIERDYLERSEEDRRVYVYLA